WPFLAFSLINIFSYLQGSSLKVVLPLLILLSFLIFFERNQFAKALFDTKAHEPGYKLGTLINQTVPEGQTAYIVSLPESIEAQVVFINYYAGHKLEFLDLKDQLPNSQFLFYNDIVNNNQTSP
ncbi:MAG: hypothetical protein ABII08_04810, partial [Candidatus Beckwithbacteria bacterium]